MTTNSGAKEELPHPWAVSCDYDFFLNSGFLPLFELVEMAKAGNKGKLTSRQRTSGRSLSARDGHALHPTDRSR